MANHNSWDYLYGLCDPSPDSKVSTNTENYVDLPDYFEDVKLLLFLTPRDLDDTELCQALGDIAKFQDGVEGFYQFDLTKYLGNIIDLANCLMSRIRVQREAIETEISRRGLPNPFGHMEPRGT